MAYLNPSKQVEEVLTVLVRAATRAAPADVPGLDADQIRWSALP